MGCRKWGCGTPPKAPWTNKLRAFCWICLHFFQVLARKFERLVDFCRFFSFLTLFWGVLTKGQPPWSKNSKNTCVWRTVWQRIKDGLFYTTLQDTRRIFIDFAHRIPPICQILTSGGGFVFFIFFLKKVAKKTYFLLLFFDPT